MLRACLVCLPAASVVDPAIGGPIGGTETRAWLFARTLARRSDTAVTFVVRHRSTLPVSIDGVTVCTRIDRVFNLFEQVGHCVSRRSGFPWLKIRQWRPQLLWQLPAAVAIRLVRPGVDPTRPSPFFQSLDGDVLCTFGVQTTSATVIASAQAAGKRAVLVLGSDGDLDEKFLTDPDSVNPYGDRASVCRFILERADAIVCQTPDQQRVLKERFGRDGVVIANPFDLDDFDRLAAAWPGTRPDRPVLWIGRADGIHKRPLLAIEIARQCPELAFLLVMNPRDPAEEARVRAAAPANVTIESHVSPSKMPGLMKSSLALLNTSSLEGFSNAFLQAGAAGVPVVSLVVGEDFLRESGGGIWCSGVVEHAAATLQTLARDDERRRDIGRQGRFWVEQHHAAATRAGELRAILAHA